MPSRRLSLAFAITFVLSLACNLFSQTPTGEQLSSTPTSVSTSFPQSRLLDEEGQPAEPELPPPDMVQALLARIENGEITREQGILDGLRLLAGELEPDQIFGDQPVRLESGWGLTALAWDLHQQSEGEVQAEIERLMAVVAPTQASLDAYAQPAGQSRRGLDVLASFAPSIQDAESCRDLRDSGFPTDRGSFPICLLYSEETIGGSTLRVYYPFELGDDPGYLTFVDAAGEALRESHAAYSSMTELRDINLILTLEPPEGGVPGPYAAIPAMGSEGLAGPCPISVYPRALGFTIEQYKQAIAHEVFHCAHFWRRGGIGYEGEAWIAEGLATHMSNVVYPEVDLEHEFFLLPFDATSVDRSLTEMTYQSYLFFQYLENRFGNEYSLMLLDEMPYGGGSDTQAAALSGIDDMNTIFHEFGQTYLRKQISDSSGALVPVRIFFETAHVYEVGEELSASRQSDTFTLTRTRFKFDECGDFELRAELSTEEGRHSWKDVEQADFIEVPTTQRVNCEGLDFWHLLTTPGNSIQLDIDIELAEEGRCDCCLIGKWEQPTDEIGSNLTQILAGLGTLEEVTGRFVMSIFRDGTIVFFPEGYTATVTIDDETVTGIVVGSAISHYTLPRDEENVIHSTTGPTAFVVTLVTSEGTVDIPLDGAALGGLAGGGRFEYQCNDSALTAFIPSGVAPFSSSTFVRLSERPEEPEFEDSESPPGAEPPIGPDIFGPTDVCPQLSLTDFDPSGNTATWTLTNESTEVVDIAALSLDWPPDNGSLTEIRLGGMTIWEGSLSGMARLTEGWSGGPADRRVDPGETVSIELIFSGDPLGLGGYIHAVEFSNGCSAVDVR